VSRRDRVFERHTVTPLAQAISAAIKPSTQVSVTDYLAALAAGKQALAEWGSSDHQPIGAVLRRPLHTMFDELARLPLPAAGGCVGVRGR
jgi:hypothetical protein